MRLGTSTVHRLVLSVVITTMALIGSVFSPSAASAATYYVATSGTDANPGTQSLPFRTIVKGFSVLNRGDTLYIRGGTYQDSFDGNVNKAPSGTIDSDAPLISNYPNETVIWQSGSEIRFVSKTPANPGIVQYLKFNGIIFDGTNQRRDQTAIITLNGVLHFTLTNCELRNNGRGNGIGFGDLSGAGPQSAFHTFLHLKVYNNGLNPACLQGSSCSSGVVGHGIYGSMANSTFDDVEAYNNGDLGMQLYHNTGGVDNNIVRNSSFHDNGQIIAGGAGLYVGSGDNNLVYNNVLYNNKGPGMAVGSGQTNGKIYNNTVYNNGQGGIVIKPGIRSTEVRNNILYANGSAYGNFADNGSGTIQSNNLTSNPLFVNAEVANFNLKSGSPAIDKGMKISIVTTSFDGIVRPQGAAHDIGAFEFRQLINPSIPAPTNLRIVTR